MKLRSHSNQGFALGTVLLFITFFFIIASAVFFASRQEAPIVEKIDNLTRARYAGTGVIQLIELKMKTLDAEFMEAILDDESNRQPSDPPNVSRSEVFKSFFADFVDPVRMKNEFGIDTEPFMVKLESVEREHMQVDDKSTATTVEKYYLEVIKVTVMVSWPDDTQKGKIITDFITKTFHFKRRYKS